MVSFGLPELSPRVGCSSRLYNSLPKKKQHRMSILRIVKYPAAILNAKGDPITAFDKSLEKLTEDMFETMYSSEGVGLAAPQIGLGLRLFVMDCAGLKIVAANPEILCTSGMQEGEEGCLSLDRVYSHLRRPQGARLRAHDLSGKAFEVEVHDLAARCAIHETDHCDGRLFIAHLSPLQRNIIVRKVLKREKQRSKYGEH